MTSVALGPAPPHVEVARRQRRLIAALCLSLAVLGGFLAALLAEGGHATVAAAAVGIVVPVVLWRQPRVGVYIVVMTAIVVEQFQYTIGSTSLGDVTEHIPLFTSLQGVGLSGIAVSPIELLLLLTVLTWLLRAAADGELRFPRGPVAAGLYSMLGIAVLGFFVGVAHGGDYKMALWEIRPWVYIAALFVLTSQLLATRRALDAILWCFVVGTGVQAVQGAWLVYETRNVSPRPEAVLAHEEAWFFGVFMALTLALWLFGVRGRLRTTATWLVPIVFMADLGNDRRTAWLILGAAIPALLVTAAIAAPERRPVVRKVTVALLAVSVVYFPTFWNDTGLAGQPARAVRSLVAPDWRDDQSNQYRKLEDANLGLNIKHSTPIGTGLGVPIDYSIPIVDISNIDSLIKYVPHDDVLYVWMRFGVAGILLFWSMIGAAILAACRLLRVAGVQTKLLGSVTVCALLGYIVQGYADLGLFWFRMAIGMGCLLGLVQAAGMRARAEAAETAQARAA